MECSGYTGIYTDRHTEVFCHKEHAIDVAAADRWNGSLVDEHPNNPDTEGKVPAPHIGNTVINDHVIKDPPTPDTKSNRDLSVVPSHNYLKPTSTDLYGPGTPL